MTSVTLERVLEIVSKRSGVPRERLTATSAIRHEVRIGDDDVTELVEALAKEFGEDIWSWPWHRYTELSEPTLLVVPMFIWRLVTWPVRKRLSHPSPIERLELGHIAKALDAGHWIEP